MEAAASVKHSAGVGVAPWCGPSLPPKRYAAQVFSMAGDQAAGVLAANRVYELIDRVPPIDNESEQGVRLQQVSGQGSFKDVTFSYPSRADVEILKGLNLDFTSGQRVALLGNTGCGKSTIISLLMRYYDPNKVLCCVTWAPITSKTPKNTERQRKIGVKEGKTKKHVFLPL